MPRITFLGLKDLNPVQQALVSAGLSAIFSLGCLLLGIRSMMAWNILLSPLILYAFMNPVMGIFVRERQLQYVGLSVLSFFLLGLLTYLAGSLISRFSFRSAPELLLISFLIPLFYFLSYLLSFLFKGVLGFLEEVDK